MRVLFKKAEKWFNNFENLLAALVLFVMAFIPAFETLGRLLNKVIASLLTKINPSKFADLPALIPGISGSIIYVEHLTLCVAFIGAMIAARDDRHLTITPPEGFLPARFKQAAFIFKNFITTVVSTALFLASFNLMLQEKDSGKMLITWLPEWWIMAIMPAAFFVIVLRFAFGGTKGLAGKIIVASGIAAALGLGLLPETVFSMLRWPIIVTLIFSAVCGAPIFAVLGGIAMALFFADGVSISAVPLETYKIVSNSTLPTIPLFTLAGYILAGGGASRRMIRLFNAWFGWLPGGLAIAAILVCTFFTTFTGASGVTIIALGGLLLPVLMQSGYKENFSTGLLTATGSLGLLFPPSLPIILYAITAGISILDVFKGALIPGSILVLFVVGFAIFEGAKYKVKRTPFSLKEAFGSFWESKWEIVIPVIILLGIFGGFMTVVESAAITAIYAFIVEVFIYRDIRIFKDMPGVLLKCSILIGGVLIILGCAMGLTNYMVDAQIPNQLANWAYNNIHSQILFLLILNAFLIIIGCLDGFSAIVVVVPLIVPVARKFGIDLVHLGIIFIANLELGYITPPIGMNLFLASYRFNKPVGVIVKATLRFLLLMLVAVLVITYVPKLTTFMLDKKEQTSAQSPVPDAQNNALLKEIEKE